MLNNANLPLTQKEKDQIAARKALKRVKDEATGGDPAADPADLLTMPALPKQFHGMKSFRQRWAVASAYTALHKWTTLTLSHIVLAGAREWMRSARASYEGLAFQQEDYDLMFNIFKMELAKRNGMTLTRRAQVGGTGIPSKAFPGATALHG